MNPRKKSINNHFWDGFKHYLTNPGLYLAVTLLRIGLAFIIFLRYVLLAPSDARLEAYVPIAYLVIMFFYYLVSWVNLRFFNKIFPTAAGIIIDLVFFSLVYLVSRDIRSEVYLFYLLPILIIAIRFRLRDLLILETLICLIIFLVSSCMYAPINPAVFPNGLKLPNGLQAPLRYPIIVGFGIGIYFWTAKSRQVMERLRDLVQIEKEDEEQFDTNILVIEKLVEKLSRPDVISELLENIQIELNPALPVDELYERAVWLAERYVKSESSAIFKLENGIARRQFVTGSIPEYSPVAELKEQFEPGEGLTGSSLVWIINDKGKRRLTGEIVVENNALRNQNIKEFYRKAYARTLPTGQVNHLIAVPISGVAQTFGVLRAVNRQQSNLISSKPTTGWPALAAKIYRKSSQNKASPAVSVWLSKTGFNANDVSIFRIIALQLASALERKLYLERLEKISRLNTDLITAFDEEVYSTFCQETLDIMSAEGCSIFIAKEATNTIELEYSNYISKDHPLLSSRPIVKRDGMGIVMSILHTINPQSLLFEGLDYREHPGFVGDDSYYLNLPSRRCYSLMLVPLLDFEQRCIGVMTIVNRKGPMPNAPFTAADEKIATIIAASLTQAVRREFLYYEKVKLGQLAELVRDTNARDTDVQTALQMVANMSKTLLSAGLVCIYPYHQVINILRTELITCSFGRWSDCPLKEPRPDGNTAHVNHSTEGWWTVDLDQNPEFHTEFTQKEGLQSLLGIQIEAEGVKIGVLFIYHRKAHIFQEAEKKLAGLVAYYIGLLLLKADYKQSSEISLNILGEIEELRAMLRDTENSVAVMPVFLGKFKQTIRKIYPNALIELRSSEAGEFNPDEYIQLLDLYNETRQPIARLGLPVSFQSQSSQPYYQTGLRLIGELFHLLMIEHETYQQVERYKELVNHFAHELSGPLSAAIHCLQNILDGITQEADQSNSIRTALRVLDRPQLLSSRIERMLKEPDPKLKPVNLVDVGFDTIREYEDRARARRIELRHTEIELEDTQADYDMIRDIVSNLVNNALKHVDTDTGIVSIEYGYNVNTVRISVTDNGTGIKEQVLPYIFNKEFTTDHEKGGKGWGLHIARKFASKHNGKIEVFSRVGSGSTFTLFLPLIRSKNATNSKEKYNA